MEWGERLHDRFALPFYLKRDLREVFRELREGGFGLGEVLEARLLDDEYRVIGRLELGTCTLTVTRALEFWPLVGDSASQEAGTSRLIDSSTSRIELVLRSNSGLAMDLNSWQLAVAGRRVAFLSEQDETGPALVCGVRYRAFHPWRGLHPTLTTQAPLGFMLYNGRRGRAYRITLHEWQPDGGAYPGLPADWAESAQRRRERLMLEELAGEHFKATEPPAGACSEYGIDLRWVEG